MFKDEKIETTGGKDEFYRLLVLQMEAVLEDENDDIANFANFSAVLFSQMDSINWCGFYLFKENVLILGPFQGKPACTRIEVGKGVCGTAFANRQTQIVENVHKFDGHIACDSDSNSEIVIPIYKNGDCVGVLDIDSPEFSRFDKTDEKYLTQMVSFLFK